MGQEEVKGRILRTCEWIAAIILVGAGCFLGGSNYGWNRAYEGITAKRDTVTKVVTMWKDRPEPLKTTALGYLRVPVVYFIGDTIEQEKPVFLHDTTVKYVFLEREQKYYEEDEGRLRLWVSGYQPNLDRWELDRAETTITETVKVKPSRWGIGINGGYCMTIVDGHVVLKPYIGAGITYNFAYL